MLNLRLFMRLQKGGTAFLVLSQLVPGKLQYFLMSFTVNYSIVTSGTCEGSLPAGEKLLSFDVDLNSVLPLLEKNREFTLSFEGEILRFEDARGQFFISPLCVQHANETSMQIAHTYQEFMQDMDSYATASEELEGLELRLKTHKANYKQAKLLYLSGGPPSDPFSDDGSIDNADAEFEKVQSNLQAQIDAKRVDAEKMAPLDLTALKGIASVAARYGQTVSMCETFAVVSLSTSYVFQRVNSELLAVQGKLLQQLLMDKNGHFYSWQDRIVFCTAEGKGAERTSTVVFLERYLPNVSVDDTLITKGAVEEKYKLNLRGMLPVISAVLGKFDRMQFDLGKSLLKMTNDSGELLQYKFDTETAYTIELVKAMRGMETASSFPMATIDVPREVQKIIGMFGDDFTIYVKKRKIIFQSGTLYVVFGR